MRYAFLENDMSVLASPMKPCEELVISQRVASGMLSPEDALQYAISLAQALRRMHRDGTVCGSLDPDRILLSDAGVKVLPGDDGGLTPYTPPEVLRGEKMDARGDVFAFGAIVYELLSGQKAFPAQHPEELRREILEQEPAPLTGVPEFLWFVLGRCLEKMPENRWQRMNSVVVELKLAHAKARHAQGASEGKARMTALGMQIAGLEERLTACRTTAEGHAAQLGEIARVLDTIQESIASLRKMAQVHSRAVESIEAAMTQTDEIVEHVVEAFGQIHKTVVERADTRNGH